MNSLFACAIVESRLTLVHTLKEEIEKRLPARTSEIMEQLQRETDRLQSDRDRLRCQGAPVEVG